jgi:hypothetical protein
VAKEPARCLRAAVWFERAMRIVKARDEFLCVRQVLSTLLRDEFHRSNSPE